MVGFTLYYCYRYPRGFVLYTAVGHLYCLSYVPAQYQIREDALGKLCICLGLVFNTMIPIMLFSRGDLEDWASIIGQFGLACLISTPDQNARLWEWCIYPGAIYHQFHPSMWNVGWHLGFIIDSLPLPITVED